MELAQIYNRALKLNNDVLEANSVLEPSTCQYHDHALHECYKQFNSWHILSVKWKAVFV